MYAQNMFKHIIVINSIHKTLFFVVVDILFINNKCFTALTGKIAIKKNKIKKEQQHKSTFNMTALSSIYGFVGGDYR